MWRSLDVKPVEAASSTKTVHADVGGRFAVTMSVLALLFLSLPVLSLVLRAVETRGWEGLPASGISDAILLSFVSTSLTAALTLVFGTPLAYTLARRRFRFKRVVNLLIELPIVLPPAVAGLALLVTFGRRGVFGPMLEEIGIALPFTLAAVVIAQTFVAAPFYIRAAQIGFAAIPSEIEDAARVDGASEGQVFRFVTLPIAQRALTSGLILSWTRALGEFGATILFAGSLRGETETMPLLVYNVLERDLDAAIWAGVILVGLAVIALLVARLIVRDDPLQEAVE